ncbi:hypothetical protein [Methanolobus profundi]|uniref:Uncharacterized protein n=1 Tax=Methanolobus profundi TaxID=487685 RepID=A0A1I4UPI8_9EURY|nr:hypothetical protein [Methanolobus profundi]SFM90917.1 hypothetical protein SAMN04488696_2829 [Methanolobus profundi]
MVKRRDIFTYFCVLCALMLCLLVCVVLIDNSITNSYTKSDISYTKLDTSSYIKLNYSSYTNNLKITIWHPDNWEVTSVNRFITVTNPETESSVKVFEIVSKYTSLEKAVEDMFRDPSTGYIVTINGHQAYENRIDDRNYGGRSLLIYDGKRFVAVNGRAKLEYYKEDKEIIDNIINSISVN